MFCGTYEVRDCCVAVMVSDNHVWSQRQLPYVHKCRCRTSSFYLLVSSVPILTRNIFTPFLLFSYVSGLFPYHSSFVSYIYFMQVSNVCIGHFYVRCLSFHEFISTTNLLRLGSKLAVFCVSYSPSGGLLMTVKAGVSLDSTSICTTAAADVRWPGTVEISSPGSARCAI